DWPSAAALFAYAAAFSLAYRQMSAGVGAFVLFGAVQATMIGWGLRSGERPHATEWAGLVVALGGLGSLGLRGAAAPPLGALALRILPGIAGGPSSLRGRRAPDALFATAGNFVRATPFAAALLLAGNLHITRSGAVLAIASGALASGLGYSL